jgi:hypothetical protein
LRSYLKEKVTASGTTARRLPESDKTEPGQRNNLRKMRFDVMAIFLVMASHSMNWAVKSEQSATILKASVLLVST